MSIESLKEQIRRNEAVETSERTVAIGHVPVKQILTKPTLDAVGQIVKAGKTYFCETKEQELIFKENNPGVETESFNIELLKSTADKYLSDPQNRKQFTRKI